MCEPAINLQVIGSEPGDAVRPGDIFAMRFRDGRYCFGRVLRANLPRGQAPMPTANLIYIYDITSEELTPPISKLTPDRLLVPPLFVNRQLWQRGYFVTVGHQGLSDADLLVHHCFRRWNGDYFDEKGRRLSGPTEPCGEWGLAGYRMVSDLVTKALTD